MTKFMIVRHGQTYFNVKKRVQGWCDSPLTKRGIEQARSLQEVCNNVDCAYSSTSERCVDTMKEIVNGKEIPTETTKAFKEIHFGDLEGEYIRDVFPNGSAHYLGYTEFGGETKAHARERFITALKQIAQDHPNQTVLIVSHGSILKEVFSILDEGFHKAFIEANGSVSALLPNCSLSVLDYDGDFHLRSYGQIFYKEESL